LLQLCPIELKIEVVYLNYCISHMLCKYLDSEAVR